MTEKPFQLGISPRSNASVNGSDHQLQQQQAAGGAKDSLRPADEANGGVSWSGSSTSSDLLF